MLKMHLLTLGVHLPTTQTHTKLMNRNTAQLVLSQDSPPLSLSSLLPREPSYPTPSPCLLARGGTSCIHKEFPVTALSSPCTTAVIFIIFFSLTSKNKEGVLNRRRWGWGYRFWTRDSPLAEPKSSAQTANSGLTHQKNYGLWTAGVISLV